ncbi:MAG: DUF6485 family protein [Bacteroidales bacterium]
MRNCNQQKNMTNCNCTHEPCSRKGNCCDCLHFHRRAGELPACFFHDEIERNLDRSVETFISAWQQGKKRV